MSLLVLPAFASGSTTSVVASAAPAVTRKVEPCGRAYQATKHAAPKPSSESEDASAAAAATVGVQIRDPKYDRYKKFDIDLMDYYTLLGLEDKMFDSTKEEITEAYRTICKVIHPDKSLPEDRVKAEERYKALQVGWETLTDAARRKGYDSSLEFDDAIPKETAGTTEKTFFSVYAPVFESNSRYSMVRPVPKLGSMDTPDDEVVAFYDFWNAFQSWREFPELNENTLESASCRQQKREYERENAKAQAGKKKEELGRVRKLVEGANKKDPRMIRMRSKANESKDAAKKKKEEEAKAKEDAAKQKIIDDAQRAEREKMAKVREAEDKKNFKEVQKKTRAAFGKSCKAAGLPDDQVDQLRASLELEQLQEIVDEFTKDAKSAHGVELFQAYVTRQTEEETKRKSMSAAQLVTEKAAAKKLEDEREAASAKPWTHDEEAILVKAVGKYPPGTLLRWETITDMVNSITSRNVKDVIRRAKIMETGQLGTTKIDDGAAYQLYLAKMAEKKSSGEVSKTQNMGEDASASAAAASSTAASASAAPAATSAAASSGDAFTAEEQALFEKALKSVNKESKTRWEQIAAQVKTKTKEQCQARFNKIRDDIKKGNKK